MQAKSSFWRKLLITVGTVSVGVPVLIVTIALVFYSRILLTPDGSIHKLGINLLGNGIMINLNQLGKSESTGYQAYPFMAPIIESEKSDAGTANSDS